MRIAIIGGGASGLISAWLLQHHHQVELFEKAPILGGHIRTLNRNVSCPGLPSEVVIENGVLGFHRQSYPNFIKLMQKLDVPLLDDRPFARLYTDHSAYPIGIKTLLRNGNPGNMLRKLRDAARVFRMVNAYKSFDKALDAHFINPTPDAAIGPLLSPNRILNTLQRAILMLSFSTPFENVDALPAGLSLPYLASLRHRDWCYVQGGVYHYVEALLQNFKGIIHTDAQIAKVIRSASGVDVFFQNGEMKSFDKIVFAVSPGQILGLLDDPTEAEHRCFLPWKDREFVTIAHTDDQIYQGYDKLTRTPMDLFVDSKTGVAGYNTSMNKAYRLPNRRPYAFSYHLEKQIRTETILDSHAHIVPIYTGDAFKTREEIKEMNGAQHCFYVGAWLGNGLHEGAVSSALEVALKLGAEW